ncbi:MAG: hypothetical protein HZC40_12595 [Chloroflexi bacterium]|nr:hypothetical protein [Chloroflexota bacterium]
MKHILRVCGTLVILILLSVIPVSVQGAASPNDSPAPIALDQTVLGSSETASLWFVELSSAPTADGSNLNTVRQEKVNFRNAARGAGLNARAD